MLVDDHAVLRSGLEQAARPGRPTSRSWGPRPTAPRRWGRYGDRPDVVLMDLQMPGADGVTATRTHRRRGRAAEVLVLTSFSDGERIVAALDAGAVGYLLKDADPEDVLEGSGR